MRWGAGVYRFRKVAKKDLFFCLLHSTSVICIFFFLKMQITFIAFSDPPSLLSLLWSCGENDIFIKGQVFVM